MRGFRYIRINLGCLGLVGDVSLLNRDDLGVGFIPGVLPTRWGFSAFRTSPEVMVEARGG